MKFKQFLCEAKIKPVTIDDKLMDWIISDILLGPGNAEAKELYQRFKNSKLSGREYYLQNMEMFHRFVGEHFFKNTKVENGTLYFTNEIHSFEIYHYDTLGAPPGKIGPCKSFAIDDAKKLKGIESWMPEKVGTFSISGERYPNTHSFGFTGVHLVIKECSKINMKGRNISKGGVLGFLKIKGLKQVNLCTSNDKTSDNFKISQIINKYLPEGDLFDCQSDLIDAGLQDYAKL